VLRRALFVFGLLIVACGQGRTRAGDPIRVWHTFGPEETEAFNEAISDENVVSTVIPFGRAQNRLRDVLSRNAPECPDLVRMDATWLPGFVHDETLLQAPPDSIDFDDFTSESLELTEWNHVWWGLPQTVDGLALLYDASTMSRPPTTLDAIESVRADGYWFAAFLRASGGDFFHTGDGLLDVRMTIDAPEAIAALARYARLAERSPLTPEPAGDEAAREASAFSAGRVKVIVGGPWTVAVLARAGFDPGRLGVAPYPAGPDGKPAAPRGGQVWVVPRCARRPRDAWRLAEKLTSADLQAAWSHRLGTVPTRRSALAKASPLARRFAEVLQASRPLARDPMTPELFDDLTPAVQAALLGDATPEEALAGVARGWHRLAQRRAQPPPGGAP
jgi:ABC-type glycerol-3-phosphate transport system substrate-binding protein